MSLLSLLNGRRLPYSDKHPALIPWQTDSDGLYLRLLRLHPKNAGITGIGGVYLLWHQGTEARWIYVGRSRDLARSIATARDSSDILIFEPDGGVYVTWAPILPEYQSGVVRYLKETLSPLILENLDERIDPNAAPIPVLPPG